MNSGSLIIMRMSKTKLFRIISREIYQINTKIDMMIIRGLPYRREARRHKLLVRMLDEVSEKVRVRHSALDLISSIF